MLQQLDLGGTSPGGAQSPRRHVATGKGILLGLARKGKVANTIDIEALIVTVQSEKEQFLFGYLGQSDQESGLFRPSAWGILSNQVSIQANKVLGVSKPGSVFPLGTLCAGSLPRHRYSPKTHLDPAPSWNVSQSQPVPDVALATAPEDFALKSASLQLPACHSAAASTFLPLPASHAGIVSKQSPATC